MLFQGLSPIGSVDPERSKGYPPDLRWEWPIPATDWLHWGAMFANGSVQEASVDHLTDLEQ